MTRRLMVVGEQDYLAQRQAAAVMRDRKRSARVRYELINANARRARDRGDWVEHNRLVREASKYEWAARGV